MKIDREIRMSQEETKQWDADAAARRDMVSAAKSLANENHTPCPIFRADGTIAETAHPAAYARNRKDW
jgi:hypothetical protein